MEKKILAFFAVMSFQATVHAGDIGYYQILNAPEVKSAVESTIQEQDQQPNMLTIRESSSNNFSSIYSLEMNFSIKRCKMLVEQTAYRPEIKGTLVRVYSPMSCVQEEKKNN